MSDLPSRHDRIHGLFEAACDLSGAERDRWLTDACAGDDELRRGVEALLAHDGHEGFLDRTTADRPWSDGLRQPERIGEFRVHETIGQGGMGIVYRASQDNPTREVALEVLAPGASSTMALRRFRREADALARLEHVGIARVYDAGSAAGRVAPDHRGDIATVVDKALAKRAADRYATAAEFGAELRRIRAHQPIVARPHSALYTARKFAARHRALVAAGRWIAIASRTVHRYRQAR